MLIIVALLALKVAIVLLVAALVARALRSASAASRHLTWTLGLIGVLALPVGSLLVPAWRIPVPALRSVSHVGRSPESARVTATTVAPRQAGSRGFVTSESAPSSVARAAPSGSTSPGAVLAALAPWWGPLVLMAWSLGSLLGLARLFRDIAAARALVRRGSRSVSQPQLDALAAEIDCHSRPWLLESEEVNVPMTFGAFRPAILVPTGFAGWALPRRREVLLHELAHVARHDWSASLVARLVKALFWFHPLVHLADRRLRVEAEQAADDLVLAHGTRASSYAAHLLGFVRATHPTSRSTVMTLSIVGGPLDQRIEAVLDSKRARGPVSFAGRVAFVVGALAVVLSCSAVGVRAEPAPSPAPSRTWDHLAQAFDGVFGTRHAGPNWSSRALDLHEEGKHVEAIECWQKAIAAGDSAGRCTYNIACAHALMGHEQQALDSLERAASLGFDVSSYLDDDDDLASLRGNTRFQALRETATHESVEARARKLAASPDSGNAAYNFACALALAGRTAEALEALERSVEIGYSDADHAEDDSDLASLRSEAKFPAILDQMRAVELPSRLSFFGRQVRIIEDEWKAARDRHEGYLARHPRSGHAWSNLGFIQLGLDAPDAALRAYKQAEALGYAPGQTAYNLACCQARAGHADAAFASLERAAALGFGIGSYLASDDDLDSLRDDARLAKLQREHPGVMQGIHDHILQHIKRAIAL